MTKKDYEPSVAIPPGETLHEFLDAREMSQIDLAKRLGITPKTVNEIVKGKAPITPETALALESVFGTPARFWMSLEANYQELRARLEQEKLIKEDLRIAQQIPYPSLTRLGVIPPARRKEDKVANLRAFFGVASLELIPNVLPAAFRRDDRDSASSYALASWLRIGEIEGAKIKTGSFDGRRLKALLPAFRTLTLDSESSDLAIRLRDLCASYGITLVFVPHLPKTYVSGATRWLTPDKVLVQLSLRRLYADIIWFNLFHEIGHTVLHGKKEVFVTEVKGRSETTSSDTEREADEFAAEQLVPGRALELFFGSRRISQGEVVQFARQIGVHPCIVVGRLQHEGKIGFDTLNHLRPQLDWAVVSTKVPE